LYIYTFVIPLTVLWQMGLDPVYLEWQSNFQPTVPFKNHLGTYYSCAIHQYGQFTEAQSYALLLYSFSVHNYSDCGMSCKYCLWEKPNQIMEKMISSLDFTKTLWIKSEIDEGTISLVVQENLLDRTEPRPDQLSRSIPVWSNLHSLREPAMLRCSPTHFSLCIAFFVFFCPSLSVTLSFLYLISLARVFHGAESH